MMRIEETAGSPFPGQGRTETLTLQTFEEDCGDMRRIEERVSEGIRTPDIQSHSLAL
jgi:hypothetical protein